MGLKRRNEELEKEVVALRQSLGLQHSTVDEWARFAPQHLRDQMAASALIMEKLDEPRALIRLGFHCEKNKQNRWVAEVWEKARQIFDTPGVKAILERDMEDAEANKAKIIARLVQTAMHGSEGDSVRASQQLAKMADWNNTDRGALPTNVTVNLMQMFGDKPATQAKSVEAAADPDGVIDADHFLLHEPGEAALIRDEDEADHKALSR
jgi:hypothetical protein